jgi:peroxiredoxin
MAILAFCVFLLPAAEESTAPPFSVKDSKGNLVDSRALLKSGPVILWFWNSCCGLKKQQLKVLKGIHQRYKSKGLTIIAVNEDEPKKAAEVKNTITINRILFIVIMDQNGDLMRHYHALAVPQIFCIAQDGKIQFEKAGYITGDDNDLITAVELLFANGK